VKFFVLRVVFFFLFFACTRTPEPAKEASSSSASTPGSQNAGKLDLLCTELASIAALKPSYALLNNLSLTDNSEFVQDADQFVEEKLNPHIVATPHIVPNFLQGDIQVRDYDLSISGVPLCSNEVSVFSRPNVQQLWMKGRVPELDNLDSSAYDTIPTLIYPTQDFAVSSIYTSLKLDGSIQSPKTREKCIIFENNHFTPALKVSFSVNNKPYMGLATENNDFALSGVEPVRSASPAFFEEAQTVEATASVLVSGVSISTSGSSSNVYQTKTVKLTGMSAGGSLCSQNFVAISLTGNPNSPVINNPPISTTEDFTYDQSNNNFYAATTFYNASTHVSWLLENNFIPNWPGPQVQIVLNETDTNNDGANNGNNNIAVYLPNGNSYDDPPQIELGNGDGNLLQKLWTDPDAIQHETGHHLIYTRVTDISNRISVVIHEGLADSQVLLQNHSPCLCPTVCTSTTSVCISTKCLRTAANNFTMAAPSCTSDGLTNPPQCLPTEVHQRSQVISGMLWDVAQDIGPSNDGYNSTLKLLTRAITYLVASSEYGDLLEALIKADEDLGSKYQSILLSEMCARGFDAAENDSNTGSWMSQISVPYTCPQGSSAIPTGPLNTAPATSGAISIPTTATGGN